MCVKTLSAIGRPAFLIRRRYDLSNAAPPLELGPLLKQASPDLTDAL
jgi:hypothetical protein